MAPKTLDHQSTHQAELAQAVEQSAAALQLCCNLSPLVQSLPLFLVNKLQVRVRLAIARSGAVFANCERRHDMIDVLRSRRAMGHSYLVLASVQLAAKKGPV